MCAWQIGRSPKLSWRDDGIKLLVPESDPTELKFHPLSLLGRLLIHFGSWFFYLKNEDNGTFSQGFCVWTDQGNRGKIMWWCARSIVNERWPLLLAIIFICPQVPQVYISWVVYIWSLLCTFSSQSWLHWSPDSYNHAFWRRPHLPETHWNPEYSYSGAYLRMSQYTHSCRGPHWEAHTPLPRLTGALLLGPFPLLGCTLNLEGEKITLCSHVWIHRVVASGENSRVLWIKAPVWRMTSPQVVHQVLTERQGVEGMS